MTQAQLHRKLIRKDKVGFTQQALSQHVIRGLIPYKLIDGKKEYKYKKVLDALETAGLLKEKI